MPQQPPHDAWKRTIAFGISALAALAALVAVRGPDPLAPAAAETVGTWLLSGPALWHPLAPAGALLQGPFLLAGPRGWQNAHVIIAWLALLCWFLALPGKNWRGLGPLLPALLAVVLSTAAAGLTGFGLAILILALWRLLARRYDGILAALTLPLATWLAVWLEPGTAPIALAAWLESWWRWSRRWSAVSFVLILIGLFLTPRGVAWWNDLAIFLVWSPQPALSAWAVVALLATLAVLPFAIRGAWRDGQLGTALAPALLLLAATPGQTAYLWPAALWMIPCWPLAKEQLQRNGFNIRWFMETAALVAAALLVTGAAVEAGPRWYALAMSKAVVQPTLTRDALPPGDQIYLNPRGAALARFAGYRPAADPARLDHRLPREPSLWRRQDRDTRYQAVWLLGDHADYAPLARHLGESPDWRLAATDATGVLFIRGPQQEVFPTEDAQQMAREMWGGANRSSFLAATALATLAALALPEAGELSQSAVRNSDQSAPAAATRARILLSLGEIPAALEQSARAIRLDPRLPLAWQVRTEVFLGAGMNDEAYAAGHRAVELAPGDAGALWLAARAANAARAFQSEAALLEKLIALTTGRGGDAGFYHLYLGQSYAKQGLARPALRSLEKAAAAPGLSDEQRREIEREISDLRASPGAR